jgi:hypothetical protein
LRNLRKNKLELGIQANQPSWCIDSWPYYEYEDWIELLNERNEEEKKSREKQEKEQQRRQPKIPDYSKSMQNFKPGSYKPPKMPR